MKCRPRRKEERLKPETTLHPTRYTLRACGGQSMIEVLLAVVVGTILVMVAITIISPSLKAGSDIAKVQTATALGKELMDNIRVLAEADWHNLTNLATSSANTYFLVSATSPFTVASGTESAVLDVATTSVATSSLVGHWKLDEMSGNTAYDYSGRGQNGTWTGSPVATSSCAVGNCLVFNGSSTYVGTGSSWTFGSDYTIAAWFKTGSSTVEAPIVSNRSGSGVVYFGVLNGKAFLYQDNCTLPGITSNKSVADNQFHFYVFVRTSSPIQGAIYVDGSLDNATTTTGCSANTGNSLRIGHDVANATEYFSGLIDDVRIYNRALSADEVAALYKSTVYERYFYLDDVYRDAGGNISLSGTSYDPSTRKITAAFRWSGGQWSSFSNYLTRSRNRIFRQSDWSGGGGQDGPVTSTNNRFATSSSVNFSTTTGSVIINL